MKMTFIIELAHKSVLQIRGSDKRGSDMRSFIARELRHWRGYTRRYRCGRVQLTRPGPVGQ